MELRQLRHLQTIARFGTLTKAAEELFITQSGLTRSIRSLEEELGLELFERRGNRLILNEYGKTMVEGAERILNEANKLKENVQAKYAANQKIQIASCAPAPLWAFISCLKNTDPELAFRSNGIRDAEDLLQGLHEKRYSVILLDYPVHSDDTVCFPVCQEVLHISVAPDHALAGRERISFEELNGTPFLEFSGTGYWHEVCVCNMPDSRLIVQNDLELYQILQSRSTLPTFRTNLTIPRFELYEDRRYIRITDPEAVLTFFCIIDKDTYQKIPSIETSFSSIDWTHYRDEDFDIR